VQQIQRTLTTSFIEAVLDGALVLLTLAMMALYSLTLSAVALAAVAVYGAAALGLLPPAARSQRRGAGVRGAPGQPLSGVAARRAGDQAVQRPGRPAVALCQPGGGHHERRDQHRASWSCGRPWRTGCCSAWSAWPWSG
jgi:hypothetical protein